MLLFKEKSWLLIKLLPRTPMKTSMWFLYPRITDISLLTPENHCETMSFKVSNMELIVSAFLTKKTYFHSYILEKYNTNSRKTKAGIVLCLFLNPLLLLLEEIFVLSFMIIIFLLLTFTMSVGKGCGSVIKFLPECTRPWVTISSTTQN